MSEGLVMAPLALRRSAREWCFARAVMSYGNSAVSQASVVAGGAVRQALRLSEVPALLCASAALVFNLQLCLRNFDCIDRSLELNTQHSLHYGHRRLTCGELAYQRLPQSGLLDGEQTIRAGYCPGKTELV